MREGRVKGQPAWSESHHA